MNNKKIKIIISGGGTGGHIFPAISIANAIKSNNPNAEILFVGAKSRMEMEKVPAAGYQIIGLPIMGFDRKNVFKNFKVLFYLLKSLLKARKIIRQFKPDAVVGVGGYASAAVLKAANWTGIPTILQEQNSYAGVTNKLLAKKASLICVAYQGMERFFPKEKIIITGNPVRQDLAEIVVSPDNEAYNYFGFSPDKKTLLIIGGSLGAKTINDSISAGIEKLLQNDIQVIWQTGNTNINPPKASKLYTTKFISRMDYAYTIADAVISRAGASTISELCIVGKPAILVPSPNVAEDHQTHNAMALVRENAAILVPDNQANIKLVDTALSFINDKDKLNELKTNISKLALPNAADRIANLIINDITSTDCFANVRNDESTISSTYYPAIYFLGIGGIGMSALAQYFKILGYDVAGYDRFKSPVCQKLEDLSITIHYEDDINLIPDTFKNPTKTLVVLTPAIPAEHSELNYFKNNNFKIVKRAEILGQIANQKKCLAIAGTHGKTSTTSICTNIMLNTPAGCSAFLGGILKNINSNFIINKNSDFVVVEADEFDRSFLQLTPYTALITHIDADHLDIYNNYENLYNAFIDFANLVKDGGNLLLNKTIDMDCKLIKKSINIYRYGFDADCHFYIDNIEYNDNLCYFDIIYPNGKIEKIAYQLGGNHNLENALAAASVAILNGAENEHVRKGLETFSGVERRFDIRLKTNKLIYIDDYAHHPKEISAFLNSVRQIYSDKKIITVFQPHLYSRTKDFYIEFAKSLSLSDVVILLPIYPAREKPIEGITSKIIFDNIDDKVEKILCEKSQLMDILNSVVKTDNCSSILVTMGAGDIDQLVETIQKNYQNEN